VEEDVKGDDGCVRKELLSTFRRSATCRDDLCANSCEFVELSKVSPPSIVRSGIILVVGGELSESLACCTLTWQEIPAVQPH
jgi:hypothetical protein